MDCPEMERRQGKERVQRSEKSLNEATKVKIAYSYNILLDLSQKKNEEGAAVVEADGRPSSSRESTYREVSEVPIRETSMTQAIRSMCFLPVNGCQYLESQAPL
jgi:hypothetical protein